MLHDADKSGSHCMIFTSPMPPQTVGLINAAKEKTRPARRSHTKSRNGCHSCKRRSVKCDELYPQWLVLPLGITRLGIDFDDICSRNCLRHGTSCDYSNPRRVSTDGLEARPAANSTSLSSPEGIREFIQNWQETFRVPNPAHSLSGHPPPFNFSAEATRLVHHMNQTATALENSNDAHKLANGTYDLPL